jgi:hypothetical protein
VLDSVFCVHLLLAAAYVIVLILVVYSLKCLPILLIDSRYVVTKVDILLCLIRQVNGYGP